MVATHNRKVSLSLSSSSLPVLHELTRQIPFRLCCSSVDPENDPDHGGLGHLFDEGAEGPARGSVLRPALGDG